MDNEKYISMFELIAEYLEVDEAEVIDNEDGETITVGESVYLVFPLELGLTEYQYCIIQLY